MNRKLLESIVDQGSILAMWWGGPDVFNSSQLQTSLTALFHEKTGLLVDLGGWFPSHPGALDCGALFARRIDLHLESLEPLSSHFLVLPASQQLYATDAQSIRQFLSNIQNAQSHFSNVVLLLPTHWQPFMGPAMASARLNVCTASDSEQANGLARELESLQKPEQFSIWWGLAKPDFKAFPRLAKGQKAWKNIKRGQEPEHLLWHDLLRIRVLLRNPPEGWLYGLKKYGWIVAFLLCGVPFLPITPLPATMTTLRNLAEDKSRFSQVAYIEMEFDGKEPIQRIARYAIGRFRALVTHETMVASYVKETLQRNSLSDSGWVKQEPLLYPPEGTRIRFYPPESITNPRQELNASAWRYFTSMFNDSIAYVTEMYNIQPKANERKHDGVDIGGRMGARILAPFSGQAWTLRDDRGGVIIGIVRGEDVMLFMHCDQLLYLDGQDVMEGDPIATVGMTGHTTGPHVHLATGLVSKNGARRIGNVRYNLLDPFEWYRIQARRKLLAD